LYKLHMKGKCLFIFMSVCPSVNLSVFLSVNPCAPLSLSLSVFSAQKDVYEWDDKLYKLHMKGKCLFVSLFVCLFLFIILSSVCLSVSLSVSVKFPMEGAEALTEKISAPKDVYELDDKLYKIHMKGKCLFVCLSVCLSLSLSVSFLLSLSFFIER
jgi:hypothetical protein